MISGRWKSSARFEQDDGKERDCRGWQRATTTAPRRTPSRDTTASGPFHDQQQRIPPLRAYLPSCVAPAHSPRGAHRATTSPLASVVREERHLDLPVTFRLCPDTSPMTPSATSARRTESPARELDVSLWRRVRMCLPSIITPSIAHHAHFSSPAISPFALPFIYSRVLAPHDGQKQSTQAPVVWTRTVYNEYAWGSCGHRRARRCRG
ncbi:hypothetical protein B0H16DRAFT_505200 [Mycena metata]|uniref:Uncharacterized protein n=1 Tax=Mycena metata TaxID=1033252 RepID=A0AAD7JE92_9AGAR|nr:hypothetical protein B0H16DRAFT_505200 [Mycena metata]